MNCTHKDRIPHLPCVIHGRPDEISPRLGRGQEYGAADGHTYIIRMKRTDNGPNVRPGFHFFWEMVR